MMKVPLLATPVRRAEQAKLGLKAARSSTTLKIDLLNRIGPKKVMSLAHFALITELYARRIRKESKRPVIVISITSTGLPYTSTINKNSAKFARQGIFFDSLRYPSSHNTFTRIENSQKELRSLIARHNAIHSNPLFIFVDSSKSPRMPSSFVGSSNAHSIQKRDSMRTVLHKMGLGVAIDGYRWSIPSKTTSNKLGHLELANEKKGIKLAAHKTIFQPKRPVDVILFNPERGPRIVGREVVSPAPHDDVLEAKHPDFIEIVAETAEVKKRKRFHQKMDFGE